MRNKLMLYVFIALVFILFVTMGIFYTVTAYSSVEEAKSQLKTYSGTVIEHMNAGQYKLLESIAHDFKDVGIDIVVEYKDKSLELFDTKELIDNNIITNKKIIRGSNFSQENGILSYIVYLDGDVSIKLSRTMNQYEYFEVSYLPYYGTAVLLIVILSVWVAGKVSYITVKPIMDLDMASTKIAGGELGRRVVINSNDELGQLAYNFNHMAAKLEKSINEVKEKQNRLNAILQSMESGVVAIDNRKNIIMINNYAKKLFNISSNTDIVGNKVGTICGELDFDKVFSNESDEIHEYTITQPYLRYLRIKCGDILVNSNQHIGAVAVIQDITDIKKLENMRTEFVANVSHELKTPLTSIRGFAETLRDVDDEGTKNKFLDIIDEEADRLTRLISDILLLSQIEQNPVRNTDEYFNADKIIDDTILLVQNSASAKNIKVIAEGDKIGVVLGSGDKFKQMIINLVDNGIKYNEAGTTVRVVKKLEEHDFIVTVEDDGIGISKDDIHRLFERFYRVDKARSRAKGGTGLGLAIVKHIVISFNGTIQVESQLGEGTKFIITIPI